MPENPHQVREDRRKTDIKWESVLFGLQGGEAGGQVQGSEASGAAGIPAAQGEDALHSLVHGLPFKMKVPRGLCSVAAGIQPDPQRLHQL